MTLKRQSLPCPDLARNQSWPFAMRTLAGFLWVLSTLPAMLAQQELDITRYQSGESVPISLSGFNSSSMAVLRFDLGIQGFEVVSREEAEFELMGSNENNQLTGRLKDAKGNRTLFYRAYPEGKPRRRIHALADDVVETILGHPGIARTMIAFRGKSEGFWEIYVSDFDGYDARRVTHDASHVAAPAWLPGKLAIYYTSYKVGSPNIISHDLRSGRRQRVTRNSGLNTSAALSPNGERIAMILSKAGSPDLYVANHDGSGEMRLTTTREEEACPTWSSDGKSICFTSSVQGGVRLFIIAARGGNIRRLQTGSVRGMVTEPDWSPDGKWIAFTSMTGGKGRICVVESTGGEATILTTGEDPCWAPNSRNLVFMREKNGRKTLSLLDVPTKQVKDIRQTISEQSQPSWAH
ncbi:hypothetical protein OAE97_03550 [Verrucomicrobia bacterium]|nr:hypothetical protein [Verrucomicrobiota bacterium]